MKIEILKQLISIANSLDAKGFQKEASVVDGIIKRAEEKKPSPDQVTKDFIRSRQGQDFSGNEIQMINAYLKEFMKNPSYFGDSGPAGDVNTTNTWNTGSNSTQEAWERFTAAVGRPELGQNWRSRATNIGYEPYVSGALKFIRDRMEATLGGSTNPAETRSVDGEMARGKHYFDTLVRHWNADGASAESFVRAENLKSQHREAEAYARAMGLEIPYISALPEGILLSQEQVTAPARGIAGTVEEGDSNLSAPGDPYSFKWNGEDNDTYTVVAANQSMKGKPEAVGRVFRKPSLPTDTPDQREAAKQSAWHILTKRRLGNWIWEGQPNNPSGGSDANQNPPADEGDGDQGVARSGSQDLVDTLLSDASLDVFITNLSPAPVGGLGNVIKEELQTLVPGFVDTNGFISKSDLEDSLADQNNDISNLTTAHKQEVIKYFEPAFAPADPSPATPQEYEAGPE